MGKKLLKCFIVFLTGVVTLQIILLFVAMSSLPLSARLFDVQLEYVWSADSFADASRMRCNLTIFMVVTLAVILLVDTMRSVVLMISAYVWRIVTNACFFGFMWSALLSTGASLLLAPFMAISEDGLVISETFLPFIDAHTSLKNLLARIDYLISLCDYRIWAMLTALFMGLTSAMICEWLDQIYQNNDRAAV